MVYLNQLKYPHVKYNHNMAAGGPPEGRDNVGTSGCGLCSACMVVDALTNISLSIEECVRLSEDNGANMSLGTNMTVLGPIIAEKFGLVYSNTESLDEAIEHLQNGGKIIAHVGHPEGKPGLFTMRGHYITLISTDGEEVCILDPSYKEDKFTIPERVGKVNDKNAPFLYCDKNILHGETKGHRYHLFSRVKK
jgi:hypothetical protein